MTPPAYLRQRQVDLGGPADWQGGLPAIVNCSTMNKLHMFVQHRLQALCKARGKANPTAIMNMPFDIMLKSIEGLTKLNKESQYERWLTTDHRLYRAWYMKLQVGLPPDQHQKVQSPRNLRQALVLLWWLLRGWELQEGVSGKT